MSRLDKFGREIPDPKPLSLPAGFKRPETLAEQVRRLVRSEQWSRMAEAEGFETFDEANDFDVEDDMPDPATPFEPFFDPALGTEVTPYDVVKEERAIKAATEAKQAARAAKKAAQEEKASAATPPQAPPQEAVPEPK